MKTLYFPILTATASEDNTPSKIVNYTFKQDSNNKTDIYKPP